MSDVTRESLAVRLEAVERLLVSHQSRDSRTDHDLRNDHGTTGDNEFRQEMHDSMRILRESERHAARNGLEHDDTPRDWRNAIGIFAESEVMERVYEECRLARDAEREVARNGVFS
jgi:hypothetical protein